MDTYFFKYVFYSVGIQSQLHNTCSQYNSEMKVSEIMWIYTFC